MSNVEEMVYKILGEPSGILNFVSEADKQEGVALLIKNGYFVWDCTDVGPYAVEFEGY